MSGKRKTKDLSLAERIAARALGIIMAQIIAGQVAREILRNVNRWEPKESNNKTIIAILFFFLAIGILIGILMVGGCPWKNELISKYYIHNTSTDWVERTRCDTIIMGITSIMLGLIAVGLVIAAIMNKRKKKELKQNIVLYTENVLEREPKRKRRVKKKNADRLGAGRSPSKGKTTGKKETKESRKTETKPAKKKKKKAARQLTKVPQTGKA